MREDLAKREKHTQTELVLHSDTGNEETERKM